MFNIMLDEKPTSWEGFPINASFRIGVQINLLLEDCEIPDEVKVAKIIDLLFPLIIPEDVSTAISWFMGGWSHDKHTPKADKTKDIDFNIDQWRIYSAFKSQYGIDLNTADLHYWEFMALLTTLEECAFTRVVDIRHKKIHGKMSKEEKKATSEAQKIYGLEPVQKRESKEEGEKRQLAIEQFERMRKGGK